MTNERLIQLEGVTKVVVEEVHGDFSLHGWGRPEAQVEWDDDIQIRQEHGGLFLQLHGDGQLYIPHDLDLVIVTVHGDLEVVNVPTTLELNMVHGDTKLEQMGAIRAQTIHGDLKVHESVGPFAVERVEGDLNVHGIAEAVAIGNVEGDARIHNVGSVTAGNIGGDMILREARGAAQVENVGGDLRTSHLHGDCKTSVGGDLKAGAVSGNLNCSVGGDALLRVMPQQEQAYRIQAGGDITCRFNPNPNVAISATSGGEIHIKNLPIQIAGNARMLQTVLGDGSAALELMAGGDITLAQRGQEGVEWEFDFNGDLFEEFGNKAAAHAERIAQQVEEQMSQLAGHLDEKFAKFGDNEEFATKIQAKVQSAMQRAEEKIGEAMRRAEERAREAEERFGERHTRREARRHHVRPQHMHHPRTVTPPTPPTPPQAPEVTSEERMMILKMLSEGQITVEQADQLLGALGKKVVV